MDKKYILLKDLEVYRLARELSDIAWEIYEKLNKNDKIIMGNQFIESADSVGANIAEGYGRYHYLDKIKFYYNARASLNEAYDHWLELILKRNKMNAKEFEQVKIIKNRLSLKLNNFINSVYKCKDISTNNL